MNAAGIMKNKKLVVFDFDDTLVTSDEHLILVTQENGVILTLNGKDWSNYTPAAGDTFDFSNLEHLKSPWPVEKVWKIFLDRFWSLGYHHVHILSARGSRKPLEKYFREEKVHVQVHCLGIPPGQNNGTHKARWIEAQILKEDYKVIEFFDDREDCVTEVAALKNKYPDILFFVWQVRHGDLFLIDPSGHTGQQ
jgi:hydroxymethylpyrimidine pyrophosphatase-like HAD family hydrolase